MALSVGVLGFQTLPLQIATASILPNAMAGMPYSVCHCRFRGHWPLSMVSGEPGLPGRLRHGANTGAITGIPGVPGTYTFVLSVSDSSGSRLDGGLVTGAAQQEKQFTIVLQ